MKELTIKDIETIVHREENRVMEAKETTGELVKGMQSGCAVYPCARQRGEDGDCHLFPSAYLRPHTVHLRRKAVLQSGEHDHAHASRNV